jgi:hypothetical protein
MASFRSDEEDSLSYREWLAYKYGPVHGARMQQTHDQLQAEFNESVLRNLIASLQDDPSSDGP